MGTWFSGLEDYPEGGVVRTFTRDGLIKIAKKCGFLDISMYYPYPDYKFMTTLYSDDRLPGKGELSSNLRNFDRERLQLFDEKLVFDTLIKEGQFPLFSNSYMLLLGKELEIKYVKYSNDRAGAFKIKTLLTYENRDGKTVKLIKKQPLWPGAKEHIEQIYTAYEKLSERFAGGELEINKCRLVKEGDEAHDTQGESVCAEFEYLEGMTLEELLDECLERNDMESFHMLFDEYYERISYHGDREVTDYDLIFSNILITREPKWYVIDYEWTFAKQVEAKEIAFRAVYCYLLESEKRNKLNLDLILNRLGITESDAAQYRQQEMKFQKYVTGKRMSMPEIRDAIGQPVYTLSELPFASPAQKRKDKVQIYEDRGDGFSEEHSFFVEEYLGDSCSGASLSEDSPSGEYPKAGAGEDAGSRNFQITIKEGCRALRIDPCSDYCIVFLKEIKWNGVPIPMKGKRITVNGIRMGDAVYAFATEDPNITIQLPELQQKQENALCVSMQVTRVPKETVCHMQKRGLF